MFSTFLLILSIVGRVLPYLYQDYDDDWGYSLGDDWEVSNNIAASNRYYNTWLHMSAQMDLHAFAQHMGRIYRGQQYDPCNPNPCRINKFFTECVAVNAYGAKCSPPILEPEPCVHGDYQLVLSWTGATGKTAQYSLLVVPEEKNGVPPCNEDFIDYTTDDDCGTVPGDYDYVTGAEFDGGETTASTTTTFTTAAVSDDTTITSHLDYIYQIILHQNPANFIGFDVAALNPDEASPVLTVKYKGVTTQTIPVPQGANTGDRNAYFFGCFVPEPDSCGDGYINTGQSGYYATSIKNANKANVYRVPYGDDDVTGTLVLGDTGLCSATRNLL